MTQASSNLGYAIIEAEGTYNTDAVNAAIVANNDLVYQAFDTCDIVPVSNVIEFPQILPSFDGVAHRILKDHLTVNITGKIRGATNPGVASGESPNRAAIFGASNQSQTVVSGTSLTLAPATIQQDAMTVYRYAQDLEAATQKLIYATGVRGNLVENFNVNSVADYAFSGLSANFPESTDTANYHGWSESLAFIDPAAGDIALDKTGSAVVYTGSVSHDLRPPFVVESVTVTVDGVTTPCLGLTFDLRWTPVPIQTINGSSTVTKVILVRAPGVRPGGTITLAETGAAFVNSIQTWLDADEVVATVVLNNGTDQLTYSYPKLQLRMPTPGDNGGVRNWSIGYDVNGDYATSVLGDNSYSATYIAAP